jgi:hypothetical protein
MNRRKEFEPSASAPTQKTSVEIVSQLAQQPSMYWTYFNRDQSIHHLRVRYDNGPGKKTILPYTYGHMNGVSGWYTQGPATPFPLYNLPELLIRKEAPVLFVEGEKTADAAKNLFPDYLITTTSGGAQCPQNSEFNGLRNREVCIWPDNDIAGFEYAERVADLLRLAGVRAITQVEIPESFPKKWDLADEFPIGTDLECLRSMVKSARALDIVNEKYELKTVCLANVEPEDVDFLWAPYIARGNLTMLDGDPGLGKSHVTLALASALSKGLPLPLQDSGKIGRTLLVSCEDSLAHSVKPRLNRMAADCDLIHSYPHLLTLNEEGVSKLRRTIERWGPDLVVIDPVFAYLGSETDINTANKVRARLAPLAKIAEEANCAMICVRHLNKGSLGQSLLYRGMGSIDVVAAARSGLTVMKHPDDENVRVILHTKTNLGPLGKSIAFTFENDTFKWLGASDVEERHYSDSQTHTDKTSREDEASHFLAALLSDGPKPAKIVEKEAGVAGITRGSLYRAKLKLKIRSVKSRAKDSTWLWELSEAQNDKVLRNLRNLRNLQEDICGSPILGEFEDAEDTHDFDPHIYDEPESGDGGVS